MCFKDNKIFSNYYFSLIMENVLNSDLN